MKILEFIEDNFLIDDAETGKLVPFILRPVQRKYYRQLKLDYDQKENFRGLREIILKARKEGFTSLILAIFAALMIMSDDPVRYLEISYKDDATLQHFRRMRTYLMSCAVKQAGLPTTAVYDQKLQKQLFGSYKEGEELVLRTNGASFYVGTASARTAERGGTVQGVLFSESAHYPNTGVINASEIIEGTQGMVAVGSGLIFHESTANGMNHFYKRWTQAKDGEISYRPRFFSWRDFYTHEEFETLKAGFSDKRKIKQEYPDNDLEAFLMSGTPFFDELAMKAYLDEVEVYEKRGAIELPMYLDKDMFTVWRHLNRGEFIILFIDPAGQGRDYCGGQGISKTHKDIPITVHYKGSILDLTDKLPEFLEYVYKETGVKPVICYEINNGADTELSRLERLNREQHYIVYRSYTTDIDGKLIRSDKLGWRTTGTTRDTMLNGVEELVRDRLFRIYHRGTVDEMFGFVKKYTPSGWRAEAESVGYDDLIMSLAGAYQLYQTENPPTVRKERTRPKPPKTKFHTR